MEISEVQKEMRLRATLTAGFVGTILNLLNNSHYFSMLFASSEFSWSGLGKILLTYLVPFAVALYSQKHFIPIYVALLNIKNAFYMLDRNNKVAFVSNKLIHELNENVGKENGEPFTSCDIKGMKIEDLALKFGFHEEETKTLLRRFNECGEVSSHNQVLGNRVNGKRYCQISALNPAVISGSCLPAQGMFIRKDDLDQKDKAAVMKLAKGAESKDPFIGGF